MTNYNRQKEEINKIIVLKMRLMEDKILIISKSDYDYLNEENKRTSWLRKRLTSRYHTRSPFSF